MIRTTFFLGILIILCSAGALGQGFSVQSIAPLVQAQSVQPAECWSGDPFAYAFSTADDRNDPAYSIYKEGKKLIYAEQWDEARKKFASIVSRYPKSGYADDATYWSAYALKHTNRKKAIEAYRKFVKDYPHSSYYDDAVADLSELEWVSGKALNNLTIRNNARMYVTDQGLMMEDGTQRMHIDENGIVIGDGPDSLTVGSNGITVHSRGQSFDFKYGFAPKAKTMERALRMTSRRLNRLSMNRLGRIPDSQDNESLDPETKLKIEALYAIGDTKEDDKSFKTLKDVALDESQRQPLREAALDALSEFKKFDVVPIYIQIAKRDTSEELQSAAIDFITEHGKDKNVTVNTLIELFNAIPAGRSETRQMIFYSVADVGNDQAIDFLTKVAKSNQDYDLRQDAIYYLGSIGGEKARTALYEILQGKSSDH